MRSDCLEKLQGPLGEVLSRLREAQVGDKQAEKSLTSARWGRGCSIAIGCVSAFYGLPLVGTTMLFIFASPHEFSWRGPVLILCLGLWLAFWIFQAKSFWARVKDFRGQDLDDDKVSTVLGLMTLFETDLGSDHAVELEMDLRVTQSEVIDTSQQALEGQNRWLRLNVRLPDRRKLQLEVDRCFKRKLRPKRKYTKVNGRCWDEITLRLSPAVAGPGGQTVRLPLQLRWLGDSYDEARQLRIVRLATPLAGFHVARSSRALGSVNLADPARLQAAVGALFLGQPLTPPA